MLCFSSQPTICGFPLWCMPFSILLSWREESSSHPSPPIRFRSWTVEERAFRLSSSEELGRLVMALLVTHQQQQTRRQANRREYATAQRHWRSNLIRCIKNILGDVEDAKQPRCDVALLGSIHTAGNRHHTWMHTTPRPGLHCESDQSRRDPSS